MKTIFKNINTFLLIAILTAIITSCNDDDSPTATLSFSRSIYILPALGSLDVELRASVAPETDLSVPINIDGTAILNEDYEISAKEFIIKSGETKATVTLTPKNNLTSDREIRLSISPISGYNLGDKNVAIIPVEIKEHIMYSFSTTYSRMLSSVEIRVELQGEISGSKYNAPTAISLPIEIDPSSTAEINTDFEIPNGMAVTIPRGSRQTTFTVKIVDGAEDYAGKEAILKLKVPNNDSELYYAGSFNSHTLKLDQLRFTDMLGKWKPVSITNSETFTIFTDDEDWVGKLPENNNPNDYLEFIHLDDGTDKIIPHLSGDLKNFFGNPQGHKITFDHIQKGITDWATYEEYDVPYFIISQINTNFSSKSVKLDDVFVGLDKIDDNNIIIYFHQYEPTDFLKQAYDKELGNEFDIDIFPSFFGITYTFTRVVE
ncbi:hypothetical protein [Bacteroides sp.]|uniref:hypothetical protein n=1 Tax=Bacteroides sp. TaxID=29523 RepID=UPI0026391B72|nr:hypothetical protein [Bacteroides sp.]MDD3036512.1 hypothetical protein [Bacteroides sp.]